MLDPRLVRMPPFAEGEWLNSNQPLTRQSLRGRIVLVDFWDYTCINCLRTLPYLAAWHERYKDCGLTIIGVHSPEFKFGRLSSLLETAVARFQIHYPILLDNEYKTWSQFATKAWPTKFLIDEAGYIRLKRQGEGYYQEFEKAIQILLRQRDPNVALPEIIPTLREEDEPGAVCFRPTPELYAGYQGGGLFGSGLGNPEGYYPQNTLFYKLPATEERVNDRFYVEGAWKAWPEAMSFAGQKGGRVLLKYTAASLNAVLAPSADEVDLALNLSGSAAEPIIEVKQDGRYLSQIQAGDDILFTDAGVSIIRVDQPRMYHLIQNLTHETHEVELILSATNLALFAFSFSSCVAPAHLANSDNSFTVN